MRAAKGEVGTARRQGLALAGATAAISGMSIYLNSYGVRSVPDAAVYTTGKNLVAALLLAALVAALPRLRARPAPRSEPTPGRPPGRWWRLAGLAYVGVVGGGLAFVLFFEGLARTSALPASFLHDTLLLWLACCSWPLLRERPSGVNLAAIGLLVGGAIALAGGVGHVTANRGDLLVLAATLCWVAETVVAKRLLLAISPGALAVVRMGVGVVTLLVYLGLDGQLAALTRLGSSQLGWMLLTGALLAGYVATWMAALARARALDVTSVLVASAGLTALLQAAGGGTALGGKGLGLGLLAAGTLVLVARWPRSAAV